MSLLVYAGASQFIAVEMISNGISLGSNRSYDLFHQSPASPDEFHSFPLFQRDHSLRMLGLLSAQLTDESFAVAMADPSKISNRPRYLVALQTTSQLAWISGSVAGALFGSVIKQFGLWYSLLPCPPSSSVSLCCS